MKDREPIFGENAKSFAIQAMAAIAVFWLANRYLRPALEPYAASIANFIVSMF